jgi:Presenilin enhancer-2 subunit of gamma secretase
MATESRIAQEVRISRILFFAGCCFLPWVWILCLIYFRKRYFEADASTEMKKYLRLSLYGTIISTLVFFAWIISFQYLWPSMGSFGQSILIYVPQQEWWLQ